MNYMYKAYIPRIEDIALEYLFKKNEGTALNIQKYINGANVFDFEVTTKQIGKILSNSEMITFYKNKQRVRVYSIKKEILKEISKPENMLEVSK